jgi:hypothetical protein
MLFYSLNFFNDIDAVLASLIRTIAYNKFNGLYRIAVTGADFRAGGGVKGLKV